jgi:type I restriction enzyme S subunit
MSKWEWKKLKDICEKGSSNIKQSDLKDLTGDYPIFGASGYIQNVDFYQRDRDYIGIIKDGSGVGRTMLLPAFSSVIGTLQYILPKEGNDIKFINYALQNIDFSKSVQGAAIPHIYFKDYGETEILVSPLSEQKRIVKFLDEEFSKIDTLKTNAETNLKNAKELFETTLEKELNPLSRHSERSEESSAELPSGWEWKTLGDVCEKISDGSHNPPKGTAANEYKMLSSKNIFNDCLNFDDPRFLTKEEFDLENKRTNVKKGDILLTIVGTIGRCCVFLEDEPVVFQRSVAVLKPNVSLVYSRFLMYGIIALNIEKLGRGAAQKGVYLKQLSNISIPLPPLSVQKEIVARLDKLSDNVKRLEANYKQIIANCDELKKSILKKTFEGES